MERRFSRPRFGRGFEREFEKPVKMGETYDVEIKEEGSRGDGIARVKNFVIFVPDAKKGDKCKIKITQVRRRFAIAEKVGKAEKVEEVEEAKEEKKKVSKAEKVKKAEEAKEEEKVEEKPVKKEGEEIGEDK